VPKLRTRTFEIAAMGELLETAKVIRRMLVVLLELPDSDVRVETRSDTGPNWHHVFVPAKRAKEACKLVAAFKEGRASYAQAVDC
jgi:hypothetical protein